ncbi:polysaccharide deacetylase family protein [Agromyces sp. M3QZ16-3]|uniref:polysaccharide deacetylase family protein n=1 Tax=Agromyces sp. M3QZ16-3 TaxID=3447585 RepID=UPI003F68DFDE
MGFTRRVFLTGVAVVGVLAVGRVMAERQEADEEQAAVEEFPAPELARVAVPAGALTELPADAGPVMAWTVDDGTDSAVVGAYTAFAAANGIRLTYFVNGVYASWDDNADAIRPLVERGQIQLANHTWSHPDLTTLSDAEIQWQLQHNHDYLQSVYGIDARPYFRPPYGVHDARVDAAAAAIGYTVPTLWYGSLGDSGELSQQQVIDLADEWFGPGRIVIGHLNHDPVIGALPRLKAILDERGLTTVTLNDVFTSEQHP